MINKIKGKLIKKLTKVSVIETFDIDGETYKIIDYTSPLPFIKDRRTISFKRDNIVYSHSAIYLNPKHHFQPILPIPQRVIALWGEQNTIKNTVVLGCAGCSVPRFISLRYPESKTIGVELCKEFIEIAKKYFLLDQINEQFKLIQGDAIKFIEERQLNEKQSIIFVDIFNNDKIIPQVFTDEFLIPLYETLEENSLLLINVLGENLEETKEFFCKLNIPFNDKVIVKSNRAQFVVLTKSTDNQKAEAFINSLKHSNDFSIF